MRTTIGLMSMLVLAGCTTMKSGPAIEINSCEHAQITNVSLERHDDGLTVRGVLRPRSPSVGRVDHVDIEFLDRDGRVIRRVKAEANVQMHMRRSDRPPEFRADIQADGIATIRLAHHADAFGQCGL
jgi:hypothetical protein